MRLWNNGSLLGPFWVPFDKIRFTYRVWVPYLGPLAGKVEVGYERVQEVWRGGYGDVWWAAVLSAVWSSVWAAPV